MLIYWAITINRSAIIVGFNGNQNIGKEKFDAIQSHSSILLNEKNNDEIDMNLKNLGFTTSITWLESFEDENIKIPNEYVVRNVDERVELINEYDN